MTKPDHPSFHNPIKENTMTDTNIAEIRTAKRQEARDAVVNLVTALYGSDPELAIVLADIERSVTEVDDAEWIMMLSLTGKNISDFIRIQKEDTDDGTEEFQEAQRAARDSVEPLDRLAFIVSDLLRETVQGDPVMLAMLDYADEQTRAAAAKREAEAAQPE